MTIASGAVTVSNGEGWALYFQDPIREYWLTGDQRGSYSRSKTPDIVFGRSGETARKRARLIVLDAKYRVEQGLNDAISSIHMYRDAIVQELPSQKFMGAITAAYLDTPYILELAGDFRKTSMPTRLYHPAYRWTFRFGAVLMRPGITTGGIDTVVDTILADAGFA